MRLKKQKKNNPFTLSSQCYDEEFGHLFIAAVYKFIFIINDIAHTPSVARDSCVDNLRIMSAPIFRAN